MSPALHRGLLILALGLMVSGGGIGVALWSQSRTPHVTGAPSIGGPFTLVDQNGVARRDSDFRGKLTLIYFGYTFCPDACPTALQTMTDALDRLGDQAAEVQPVFITVDPARDTVAQLKLYAANFHPRLLALTGSADEVAAAVRAFHVYAQKVEEPGDAGYSMDHSSFVYLMGRDGQYLGHFPPGVTAKTMAADIKSNL